MANHINHVASAQKSHPLLKTGIITTGTHLGTKLIHKIAMRPLLVFGVGIIAGIVLQQKNQEKSQQQTENGCCSGQHSETE